MRERIYEVFQEFFDHIIQGLPSFMVGTFFLLLFLGLGLLLRFVFRKRVAAKADDPLLANFIGRLALILMLIFGGIIFLNQLGLSGAAGGLLAGAGVTAVVLGFAFQDIGENFLSGFFLAFGRPFGVGDIIEIEGFMGKVNSLNLRNTHIRTFDGRDIFIPNSLLIKNPLVNYTRDGLMRHDFVIGLDYGSDVMEATRIIMETLRGIDTIVKSDGLMPFVTIDEFSTSTINLRVHFWINTYDILNSGTVLKSEVMREILNALIRNKFNLPADIVELKIYQEGQPIPVSVRDLDAKTG
ncbi:mechanosensitive ion channel family protein [Catalinimonas alkaloidigena]|uniref:mechanosensitive ion channel family protein n=1 Tax=Catalinimonas alkaloidigena TaxID=1075417 RepID=UPI0015A034E2|nr:mechanosensitive ion channel family protein [Catalinimonas alkaloidigena]